MASSTVLPSTTTTNNNTHQNQIPESPNLPPQSSSLSNNNTNNNINNNNNNNNNNHVSKKRPRDFGYHLQSSPYFKFRAILKDLRPLFLEVLRAPDFQNCEAARRIQEKMKLMVDLCRLSTAENVPLAKCSNASGNPDFGSSEKHGGQKPVDQSPQEKPMHGSHRIPGTYIVGGSAFGWNFITFHGTKPEYYGRTKESFRAGK